MDQSDTDIEERASLAFSKSKLENIKRFLRLQIDYFHKFRKAILKSPVVPSHDPNLQGSVL